MTLTEQMKADGWIEHDGSGCPVPLESKPAVMFRDGEIADADDRADAWVWEANSFAPAFDHLHIIAYRPEQPQ